MSLFRSRQSACTFGTFAPEMDKAKEGGEVKRGMRYATHPRPFGEEDVRLHLQGRQSIVAIPILDDGTCAWAALDIDEKCPKLPSGKWLHWFQSKSGFWHGFVFFERPQKAASVRFHMAELAEMVGHKGCEVFPKQDAVTPGSKGSGINLPFFGEGTFDFDPSRYPLDLPAAPEAEARYGPQEDGYWCGAGMLAMLLFYAEHVPRFEFRPFRGKFQVPCPGYDEGWGDGSKHSSNMFPRISHEALVWVDSKGWPCFRCVHSHCDDEPKKTFNDWRGHWDSFRLWDYGEWLESELEKKGDYVR
jgi:hypothetical protein